MKKIVTRLAALLLALLLTLPALAESEPMKIEGGMVKGFGYSVEEWMATDASRATFVALAMLDMVLSGGERVSDTATEALLEGTIYVASDEDSVACYLYGKLYCLAMDYAPEAGATAEIIPMGRNDAATMMASLREEKQYAVCEQIDVQLVMMMMEFIMGALMQ